MLRIKVDVANAIATMKQLREEQLPFTIARSLTLTAQSAQAAVRDKLPSIFRLRNTWTAQGIRILAAEKKRLAAAVYTDTANRKTGAGDYLGMQESGGEKVPFQGRQHLAIPTRFLTALISNGVIPEGLRPRVLLAYADQQGKYVSRSGKMRAMPALIKGMEFFVQRLEGGDYAILGRRPNSRQPMPFYLLVSEARVKPRFPMEKIVQEEVSRTYETNFKKAAIETMSSDLLRGSGVRLRL